MQTMFRKGSAGTKEARLTEAVSCTLSQNAAVAFFAPPPPPTTVSGSRLVRRREKKREAGMNGCTDELAGWGGEWEGHCSWGEILLEPL